MFEGRDQAIAALLRAHNLVPAEALASLVARCRASGRSLTAAVLDEGLVERAALLRAVADALGLAWAGAVGAIAPELPGLVPAEVARKFGVVPWRAAAHSIDLLVLDPFGAGRTGELAFALGRDVRLFVADPVEVSRLLQRHYGGDPPGAVEEARDSVGNDELARLAAQPPVISLVEEVLSQAVQEGASDVHFEPFDGEFRIRCRVDGALRDYAPLPPALSLPVISRLKVLAGLNIAERRLPQDGRIRAAFGGRTVDLRISTLPTQGGESVVLRVLDRSMAPLNLSDLGMSADVEAGVREVIGRPHGILLVTGPTGSGKTTTLYSCLRILNDPERKVLTAEDPVEYEIEGVMQLAVHAGIGLTFAAALRSFLRQDPDVMMVGEIRDLETAQVAIRAALTGHLVLSSLHTRDAAGAVSRLVDLGVEPYLLCATVAGVLAQRLVRCVCPGCSEAAPPNPAALRAFGLAPGEPLNRGFLRARGCAACGGTGYRGRLGIFEWLRLDGPVRDLVMRNAPAVDIKRLAVGRGMQTLRAAGVAAARSGATTLEELARCL